MSSVIIKFLGSGKVLNRNYFSITLCSSLLGLCNEFLSVGTAEAGSVISKLYKLVTGEIVWNPP